MNTNHDSYDQYADQLLNSVFANAKQATATASAVPTASHEDHLLNQLFQNARISSPAPLSPFLNNNNSANNEWLLLQQLQQQQQLIEKQLSAIVSRKNSTSPVFQVPVVDSSAASPSSSSELVTDAKPKKIARVPVQQQQFEGLTDSNHAALVKPTGASALHNATNRPALPKKKSFLRRTLSRRNFKDRETVAPVSATTTTTKSVQPKATKLHHQPVANAVVEKSPTFWKPREERPKGWWKGTRSNSTATQQQQYYHYEENEDEDQEDEEVSSEEEVPDPVPVKKTKKKVVKRVVVPQQQKVPSIKKKAQRPMAFKSPTIKAKKKKNKAKEASSTATKSTPMYVMPQKPMYYQQPMMMPSQPYMMPGQAGNGYYCMPGQGMMMMSPSIQQNEESSNKAVVTRRKTVLNPRETTNDKCTIM